MNSEQLEMLEEMQEQLRDAEDDFYAHDGVYGVAIILDSVLNEDLTLQEAVNEFIANSDLEIQAEVIEAEVI